MHTIIQWFQHSAVAVVNIRPLNDFHGSLPGLFFLEYAAVTGNLFREWLGHRRY